LEGKIMSINRREFLQFSALVPAAFLAGPAGALAADGRSDIMAVSKTIIGRDDLSAEIGARIADLLRNRIGEFDAKLTRLAHQLDTVSDKNKAVEDLQGDDLAFALEIAKPWYLGYVGTPGGTVLTDDGTGFVTYLDARAYEVVAQDLPRTSYPPGGRGWWQAVPPGVSSPPMPEGVTTWGWQPDNATGNLAASDPAWVAYGMGEYPSLAAARAALSNGKSPSQTKTIVPEGAQ
jgi:fructose 5-dehydrogenase small subunit